MRAGDHSRFYVVLMPSHFSCVFWSKPSVFLQHLWGIDFVLCFRCFFPIWFLSLLPVCVLIWSALSSGPGGKRNWFWLVCLDVVSEVLRFLTCWPCGDPAVSLATAPAVRGCGSNRALWLHSSVDMSARVEDTITKAQPLLNIMGW